jgi:hypothetical protein
MWRCCGKCKAASGWEQNEVYGVMWNTESVTRWGKIEYSLAFLDLMQSANGANPTAGHRSNL